MKSLLVLAILSQSAFAATKDEVWDFVQAIEGEHTMQGKGCGVVKIKFNDHPQNRFSLFTKSSAFQLSIAEKYKISGNVLKYYWTENDDMWPMPAGYVKEEITIKKNRFGDLESVSYRRAHGAPFYLSSVTKYHCTTEN